VRESQTEKRSLLVYNTDAKVIPHSPHCVHHTFRRTRGREGGGWGWDMSLQLHSTFAAFTVEEIPPLPGWRLQRRHVLDGFHTIGPYFTIAFVIIGWRREKESP
jgi:hypothetical protein